MRVTRIFVEAAEKKSTQAGRDPPSPMTPPRPRTVSRTRLNDLAPAFGRWIARAISLYKYSFAASAWGRFNSKEVPGERNPPAPSSGIRSADLLLLPPSAGSLNGARA